MYKITYELHCHKEDGSYDKKLSENDRIVSEDYRYKCRPWWRNQNKIEEYDINQINIHLQNGYFKEDLNRGLRKPLSQYLLSEGEDIDSKYYFEKIIKLEKYEK